MGKRLIIKGADFYANRIEQVGPTPIEQWVANLSSADGTNAAWTEGPFIMNDSVTNFGGRSPSFYYGKKLTKVRLWIKGSDSASSTVQIGYYSDSTTFVPFVTLSQSQLNVIDGSLPAPFSNIEAGYNEITVNEILPSNAYAIGVIFTTIGSGRKFGLIVTTGQYGEIKTDYVGFKDNSREYEWTPFVDFQFEL